MSKHHPTPRTRQRATMVMMSSRGFSQTAISKALGVSWPYVHRALSCYSKIGFLSLMEHHPGATDTLHPEQVEQLINWLELGPKYYHYSFAHWTTRPLQWRLWVVFQVSLTREAIRQLLHRLGFRWKRPQATYARVDQEARTVCQLELANLFQQANDGKIILLLQDEAIISLQTTVISGWSRVGHCAFHRKARMTGVVFLQSLIH